MTKTRLVTLCVVWAYGTLGCGSSESQPIFDSDAGMGAGTGGAAGSTVRTGGNPGVAGASAMTGGLSSTAGSNTGGSGNPLGSGGASGGSGGVAGSISVTGGNPGSGGASATTGGLPATAGSNSGGTSSALGSGGTSGSGGSSAVACNSIHPNVNGTSRTCNAGYCYCSSKDGCFEAAVASSCCVETVVCEVGSTNPVATINHPGNGETRNAGESIPFIGVATDPQDGALGGAALVWTSNRLTSPIGTGLNFNAALPAGTHVITLTATDSDSNTSTDTITLIIQ